MNLPAAPFRFLFIVLAGWSGLRTAASFLPALWADDDLHPIGMTATRESGPLLLEAPPQALAAGPVPLVRTDLATFRNERASVKAAPGARALASAMQSGVTFSLAPPFHASPALNLAPFPLPQAAAASMAEPLRPGRWSGDAWLFLRDGRAIGRQSPGLGGSQAGGRLRYRLASNRLLGSLRAQAPLEDLAAGDAAIGLDWQPVEALPMRLLAERRQAFGARGRSAFSATLYGGFSGEAAGGTLDLYGQAGIVGAHRRDLFADGAATLRWSLAPEQRVKAGLGVWGGAQPGVARVDIGPSLAVRPLATSNVTVNIDWRQRIAGNAAPSSGPAITLTAGF